MIRPTYKKLKHILTTATRRNWIKATILTLLSIALHLLSLISLNSLPPETSPRRLGRSKPVTIKIKYNPKQKQENFSPKDDSNNPKKILETKLTPNQAPKKADYLGQQDHTAKKISKSKKRPNTGNRLARQSAKTKVLKKKQTKTKTKQKVKKRVQPNNQLVKNKKKSKANSKTPSDLKKIPKFKYSAPKGLALKQKKEKAFGSNYNSFLNTTNHRLSDQQQLGYQEYISENLEESEAIDLNTKNYRYIGYFTNMRRAIELVWSYPPTAARKGASGKVRIIFIIESNGSVSKIRLVDSSGYEILDHAIVEAIQLASPFAPLPETFRKDQLSVSGTFSYVLN